jgi:hypothetical protein
MMTKTSLQFWFCAIGWVIASTSLSVANVPENIRNDVDYGIKIIKYMKKKMLEAEKKLHDQSWVQKKLDHMFEVDQFLLRFMDTPIKKNYSDEEKLSFQQNLRPHIAQFRAENTTALKEILDTHGWIRPKKFGKKYELMASVIINNSDHDLEFQKSILKRLQKMITTDQASAKYYAELYDRVHSIGEKTLQKYGTQGFCHHNGTWRPYPISDPEQLETRRKKMQLKPMSAQITENSASCVN